MDRKLLARRIAEESIVLLKNEDHMLPLKEKKEIAFFGRTQIGTLYSGNGSGGANVPDAARFWKNVKIAIRPGATFKGLYEYKINEERVTEEDEFDWTKVSEMVTVDYV